MPGTNEAFSRVKIDAQLKDQGWDVLNPNAVRFEYVLPDKTKADYVLCDRHGRALAVIEAKRAAMNPAEAEVQVHARARACNRALSRAWSCVYIRATAFSRSRRVTTSAYGSSVNVRSRPQFSSIRVTTTKSFCARRWAVIRLIVQQSACTVPAPRLRAPTRAPLASDIR